MYCSSMRPLSAHFSTLQNKNRINKAGELLVTSELSRSQQRNLSDCVQKIAAILAEASERPRDPTAEDVALRDARYSLGGGGATWTVSCVSFDVNCDFCAG